MSKIKNGGLDQYGTEPFEQQQFGTARVKGLTSHSTQYCRSFGRSTVFLGKQLHW